MSKLRDLLKNIPWKLSQTNLPTTIIISGPKADQLSQLLTSLFKSYMIPVKGGLELGNNVSSSDILREILLSGGVTITTQ